MTNQTEQQTRYRTCRECGAIVHYLNMVIHMREEHPQLDDEAAPAATQATDASWLLAGSRDLSIPAQHHFTAHPVTPQMERAATERARQAAVEGARSAAWFAAHHAPDAIPVLLAEYQQLTADLAALRAVARGYCPHCGRGDAAPTVEDWERERQRAEQAGRERDEARQHAAAIAAQRDRLRQRMHTLADRWDTALAVDKPYARTLRTEISVAPFEPDAAMAVKPYRADDGSQKWVFRCWGTDTCDGYLSLDHDTERWAQIARDRHVTEAHTPAATDAQP